MYEDCRVNHESWDINFLSQIHFTQGNYTGTATITDQMNDEVLCIKGGCEITG